MKSRIVGPSGSLSSSEMTNAFVSAIQQTQGDQIVAQRYHDASSTTIPAVGSNPVALGSGAVLGTAAKALTVESTVGEPLQIMVGATAGAAQPLVYVGRGGEPNPLRVDLPATALLWVKTLNSNTATSGELTVNFIGD